MTENNPIQFNEHNFEIAKLAIEDPEVFRITGILISPQRTVVTNGAAILEITTPSAVTGEQLSLFGSNFEPVDEFEPFLIPRKEAIEISKAIALRHDKEEVKRARIGQGDDNVAVVNVSDSKCDRTFVVQKLAQKFPDHDAMFSKFAPGKASVTVDCAALIPLLQVIAKATDEGLGCPVTITMRDQEGCVTFDWRNGLTGQTIRAALAPMKM